MHVAIRPSFQPGGSGGVEQYVHGLLGALSELDDEGTYDLVGSAAQRAALAPSLPHSERWVEVPTSRYVGLRHSLGQTRFGEVARRAQTPRCQRPDARIPCSPAQVEEVPYDVVHFPDQGGERTRHPSIYQPWDLQHLHYPEYFSRRTLAFRAVMWPECCRNAAIVLVASEFVRQDVAERFDIDPSRIAGRSPGAPLTPAPSSARRSRPYLPVPRTGVATQEPSEAHRCDRNAAVSWNRGRSHLQRSAERPGSRSEGARTRRRGESTTSSSTRGTSPPPTSPGFTRRRAVSCFPLSSRGSASPVLEAFAAGVPVACSGTTSLPELAAGAALFFDPTEVDSIATRIESLWTDDILRTSLVAAGAERATLYSSGITSREDDLARALYRPSRTSNLEPEDEILSPGQESVVEDHNHHADAGRGAISAGDARQRRRSGLGRSRAPRNRWRIDRRNDRSSPPRRPESRSSPSRTPACMTPSTRGSQWPRVTSSACSTRTTYSPKARCTRSATRADATPPRISFRAGPRCFETAQRAGKPSSASTIGTRSSCPNRRCSTTLLS